MTVRSNALLRVVVLLTVAVAALFLLLANQVDAGDTGIIPTFEHVVRSGETLWEIAGDHTADGADVRYTVREIRVINVLDSSTIYPGDRLLVPVIEG